LALPSATVILRIIRSLEGGQLSFFVRQSGVSAGMTMTKLDLGLLCVNLFALGGIIVLMMLRGPSAPAVLLTVGAAGMAISRLGKAFASATKDEPA
jgi:hypothetical protein